MYVMKYLELSNDLFSIGPHKSEWISSKVCVALVPTSLNDGRICLPSKQDVHIIFRSGTIFYFKRAFRQSLNGRLRCPSLWCHTYESWSEVARHATALVCVAILYTSLIRYASATFLELCSQKANLKIDLVHIGHLLLVFVLSHRRF